MALRQRLLGLAQRLPQKRFRLGRPALIREGLTKADEDLYGRDVGLRSYLPLQIEGLAKELLGFRVISQHRSRPGGRAEGGRHRRVPRAVPRLVDGHTLVQQRKRFTGSSLVDERRSLAFEGSRQERVIAADDTAEQHGGLFEERHGFLEARLLGQSVGEIGEHDSDVAVLLALELAVHGEDLPV